MKKRQNRSNQNRRWLHAKMDSYEIARLYDEGMPAGALAKRYGVGIDVIWDIVENYSSMSPNHDYERGYE